MEVASKLFESAEYNGHPYTLINGGPNYFNNFIPYIAKKRVGYSLAECETPNSENNNQLIAVSLGCTILSHFSEKFDSVQRKAYITPFLNNIFNDKDYKIIDLATKMQEGEIKIEKTSQQQKSEAQNKPLLFRISGLKAKDIPATNALDHKKATAEQNIENYVDDLLNIIKLENTQNQEIRILFDKYDAHGTEKIKPIILKIFEKLQEETATQNLKCEVEVRENWWRHLPQASCVCCNATLVDASENQRALK